MRERKFPVLAKLKGRIREMNSSYRKLAKALNVMENTLYLKINGFYPFNCEEICIIADELDIAAREIGPYFFPHRFPNYTKD